MEGREMKGDKHWEGKENSKEGLREAKVNVGYLSICYQSPSIQVGTGVSFSSEGLMCFKTCFCLCFI